MKTKEIISQAILNKISTIIYFFTTLILAAVFQIFCVLIIRELVDNVFSVPVVDGPRLSLWIASFAISLILMLIMGIINKNLAIKVSANVSTSLTNAAYSASLRAEINSVEEVVNDEMVARVIHDSNYIGDVYIGQNWYLFLRNTTFLVAYFIAIMIVNPILGLITYGALPVFYTLVKSYDKYFSRVSKKAEVNHQARIDYIVGNLKNIRTLKLRNGITKEEEKLIDINNKYVNGRRHFGGFKDIKDHKLFDLLIGLLFTLLLGVGGYLSTRGEHIPGDIIAVVFMTPMIYRMFNQLIYNIIYPSYIEEEVAYLDGIISIRSELKVEPITSLEDIHSFTFENVSYSNSLASVKDINFELKKSEKLGIISLDKDVDSIVFDLLTKLIRPKSGLISINNCDINKISTLYLRDLITAIPKEKKLFNETIAMNIIYPLEFDEYKYNDALNKSGLKEILQDFELKDQTIVSEDNPLSPEIQARIIYANAFYKDSKIFVLNDSETELEPRDEEAILQEIFELKNKIIIMITDKNYNVLACDKVLVLGQGEVLEYGNVEELLKNKQSLLYKLIKKVKTTKSAKVS